MVLLPDNNPHFRPFSSIFQKLSPDERCASLQDSEGLGQISIQYLDPFSNFSNPLLPNHKFRYQSIGNSCLVNDNFEHCHITKIKPHFYPFQFKNPLSCMPLTILASALKKDKKQVLIAQIKDKNKVQLHFKSSAV